MIGKTGSGWQTTTADLALILFLVVSAASTGPKPKPASIAQPAFTSPALDPIPPSAIYRATAGTSLPEWLASQPVDDRQIVTVIVKRAPGSASPSMDQGLVLLDEIKASGRVGRLLVEPDTSDDVAVVLAYDRAASAGTALALK